MMNKKMMKTILLILCLLFSIQGMASTESSEAQSVKLSKKERWKTMSKAQKELMRKKYKKFMSLKEDKKKQMVARFRQFQAMDAAKKQRVIRRFKKFNALSESKRRRLRARWTKWNKMSPTQQKQRMELLKKYRMKRSRIKPGQSNIPKPTNGSRTSTRSAGKRKVGR